MIDLSIQIWRLSLPSGTHALVATVAPADATHAFTDTREHSALFVVPGLK